MLNRKLSPRSRKNLWTACRLTGIVLSAVPVVLMLATGAAGSLAAGRLLIDFFLPAELFSLSFPGMLLIAAAALGQKVLRAVSAALPAAALLSLLLCQGTALLFGPVSGGPARLAVCFLLLYDLAAAAAPAVGIWGQIAARRR